MVFIASEKRTSPEARSTDSTKQINSVSYIDISRVLGSPPGTTKVFNETSSGMGALGSTNAPVLISGMFGVLGEDGFVVNTTLAKCVGTATFGGEPMTSCV